MPTLVKKIKVTIEPHEAAEIFCEMDDKDQARFLNEIGRLTKRWTGHFSNQLQAVVDNGLLSEEGRYIMQKFGEYALEGTVTQP